MVDEKWPRKTGSGRPPRRQKEIVTSVREGRAYGRAIPAARSPQLTQPVEWHRRAESRSLVSGGDEGLSKDQRGMCKAFLLQLRKTMS